MSYDTSDLSLCAFLRARGHKITDVRYSSGRGRFTFEDNDELREDILRYSNDEPCTFAVRSFLNLVRDLKGLTRMA